MRVLRIISPQLFDLGPLQPSVALQLRLDVFEYLRRVLNLHQLLERFPLFLVRQLGQVAGLMLRRHFAKQLDLLAHLE